MLPKGKRMKGEEITPIFLRARTIKTPYFVVKLIKSGKKPIFAVAASKKNFKTAVERNRVRRRIYSAIRSAKSDDVPYSFVFIPNQTALKAPYRDLVGSIVRICQSL